jgi:hypothetical protein
MIEKRQLSLQLVKQQRRAGCMLTIFSFSDYGLMNAALI